MTDQQGYADRYVPPVPSVDLSVVVPMFDEELALPFLFPRLRQALDGFGLTYEVVAVDDGSRDATVELTESFRAQWPELRLIRLLRNSGHQAAIGAGLGRTLGAFAVTLDADLQDPPEAIVPMYTMAREQHLDVVYGVRIDRSSDSWGKRLTANLYYRLMRHIVGRQLPAGAGDFRLMSRRVLTAVERQPQQGRVYRLIVPWLGFPSQSYGYVRDKRVAGTSKYPLTHMLRLAWDSIAAFSAAPLRLATWGGGIAALGCVGLIVAAFIVALVGDTVPGWTSTLIAVMGIGAVQLICLGMLGEYVSRIFTTIQARPTFIVGYDSHEQDRDDHEDPNQPRWQAPSASSSMHHERDAG